MSSTRLLLPLVALAALLPATGALAAPPNDARDAPGAISAPSGTVTGTLADATLQGVTSPVPGEPPRTNACGRDIVGDVWYRLTARSGARLVVRLKGARKDLTAVLVVSRISKSGPQFADCEATEPIRGEAAVSITPSGAGVVYEIAVGQIAQSTSDTRGFRLSLTPAPPDPGTTGAPLPAAGGRGTVDRVANRADSYAKSLHAGQTYRVNLAHPAKRCVSLVAYSSQTRPPGAPSLRRRCGGYLLVTPDENTSGTWSFHVEARDNERYEADYRLSIAPVREDDMTPGLKLADRRPLHGQIEAGRIDVVDVYRVDIAVRSYVTLRLATADQNAFDLKLISRTGGRVACACGDRGLGELRKGLHRGRFFLVVSGRGRSRGHYKVTRIDRALTGLALRVNGQRRLRAAPGTTLNLGLGVNPDVDGPADVRIERYDPLSGWHFHRDVRVVVRAGRATVPFLPPSEGTWRAVAHFRGTNKASPSDSRWVQMIVQAPLSAGAPSLTAAARRLPGF